MATADDTGLATLQAESNVGLNRIVEGNVIHLTDENVLIDVGFKSEGVIPLSEWEEGEELPQAGDTVKVLIEELEDGSTQMDDPFSMISLSKRKAEKILAWQEMMKTVEEGQVVTGTVTRKI